VQLAFQDPEANLGLKEELVSQEKMVPPATEGKLVPRENQERMAKVAVKFLPLIASIAMSRTVHLVPVCCTMATALLPSPSTSPYRHCTALPLAPEGSPPKPLSGNWGEETVDLYGIVYHHLLKVPEVKE